MKKEYVVYKGAKFTIEWFFTDKGKSPAKEYFDSLNDDRQDQAFRLFKMMAQIGQIRNITKFRHEGEGIFVFKPKPDRFFCFFFSGKKILITNAYEKKKDELSQTEKKKAQKLQQDYSERVEKGIYYE